MQMAERSTREPSRGGSCSCAGRARTHRLGRRQRHAWWRGEKVAEAKAKAEAEVSSSPSTARLCDGASSRG